MNSLTVGEIIKGGSVLEINGLIIEFPKVDSTILSCSSYCIVLFDGENTISIDLWNDEIVNNKEFK